MAQPQGPERVHIFNGGVKGYRAFGPADSGDPYQWTKLLNANVEDGTVRKRGGYTNLVASLPAGVGNTGPINSMYFTRGFATNLLVFTANTRIYKCTTAGVVTEIASGLTSGARWGFAEIREGSTNMLVMFSPTDAPQKWDGTAGTTTAMTAPAENCGIVVANTARLFATGGSTNPRRIYSTDLNTISTWNGQGYFDLPGDINEGNATGIVCLTAGRMVAFTDRATYLVYGVDLGTRSGASDMDIRKVSNIGCVAPRSIVVVDGMIYFLGSRGGYYGIFATDGTEPEELSADIRDDLQLVNTSYLTTACGVQIGRHVYISAALNAATDTSVGFLLHLGVGRGYPFAQWNFAAMPRCMARDTLTGKVYWGEQGATGKVNVYSAAATTDAGAAIDMDVQTGPIANEDPVSIKRLAELNMMAEVSAGGSMAVSFARDGGSSWTDFGGSPFLTDATGSYLGVMGGDPSHTWDGVAFGKLRPDPSAGLVVARSVRLRFRENTANGARLERFKLLTCIEE